MAKPPPPKPEPKSAHAPRPVPSSQLLARQPATVTHDATCPTAQAALDLGSPESDWLPFGARSDFRLHLEASGMRYRVNELAGIVLLCPCRADKDAATHDEGRAPSYAVCPGEYLATLANALQFDGLPCPRCKLPVESSPIIHADGRGISEYWRCVSCKAFGFEARSGVLPT